MRPHRLAFCALGPYPDKVEIEFDELVSEGLFLIWGRTGAGKTFLLDALCFALFGEVPGARPYDTLRSDHAPLEVSPWADLEFTVQGDRWRIHRVPAHERAKKRGSGTTGEKASAALERLVGETWQPVAEKIPEVDQEVVQLLGLTASEFQQVVLLPQGRFERALRSTSGEREKLLLTLFETSIYESAASWLDAEAERHRTTATGLEERLHDLRRTAAERWREVSPADESSGLRDGTVHSSGASSDAVESTDASRPALGSVASSDAVERVDAPWPADQSQLDDLVEQAQSVADDAADAAKTANARYEAANEDHSKARQLAGRWNRRNELQKLLRRLVDAEANIDTKREALGRADDAQAIRQVLDDEADARSELDQCTAELSAQYATLRECMADALSLPDELAIPAVDDPALQTNLAPIGRQVSDRLDELGNFAADACTASKRESEAAAKRESATCHLEQQQARRETAEEHDFKRVFAEAGLRAAESAAGRISALTTTSESAHEQAAAAAKLQSLAPKRDAAEKSVRDANQTTLERRKEELDLRERRLDGMAAVLAGELLDAVPCPVCGSTEHPIPAEPADDAVRDEHLEAASAAVERAVEAEDGAREVLRGINSRIDELRGRAGDAADNPDAAARQSESAAAELAAANELAGNQHELREASEYHRRQENSARQQSSRAETDAALALDAAERAEREAGELRSKISQAIGEVDPDEAVAALRAVESCLSDLQTSVGEQTKARTALHTLAGTLEAQLKKSPFASADEARSALLDDAVRDELREEVKSHDDAMRDTRRDLGADDLQCLPDDRPDTEAAEEAANAERVMAKEAGDHHTLIASARDAIRGWADDHREVDAEYASAFADAELWTAVADRCSGRLAPRVSLQRWILSAYLERICQFANRRLGAMSGSRYRLSVHRESERHGAKGGLGLRVHDAHTGAEREVSTLSGGETFQASLALALGVADVVTARTGGVRLEVLFVDEGFGTLDSEALHLAMDELDRLREGGRAVGLISHVSELRVRIRTGIEVHRTDKGSHTSVGAISEL